MKKILLSVLVLWAAGAYSQEIRMPDEKREDYVKEQRKITNSTSKDNSESADRKSEEVERRQRELEARKRATYAAQKANSGKTFYCIIHESTTLDGRKSEVTIEVDNTLEKHVQDLDKRTQKALMLATEKRGYKNALGALNNFSMNGWTLSHASDYMDLKSERIVHRYLIGYNIP